MTLVSYGENHARNSNLKWDYLLGYGQIEQEWQNLTDRALVAFFGLWDWLLLVKTKFIVILAFFSSEITPRKFC
jgi:hypothetical protein